MPNASASRAPEAKFSFGPGSFGLWSLVQPLVKTAFKICVQRPNPRNLGPFFFVTKVLQKCLIVLDTSQTFRIISHSPSEHNHRLVSSLLNLCGRLST